MPVEFLGIAGTNPAGEVTPRTGGPLDLEYTPKLARAHEDNGWPTGGGNSTALVGTPETVAAALLDYYDLGIRIFSARGYDIYDDAIDFGRHVIPLVRSEVAHREQRKAS